MAKQVSALSKLGYQVADKGVAAVLVELHNRRIFEAGLVVVGTLAYMSWLNEYGTMATAARTQDIDLARRQSLKLATPISFLSSMQATRLPFVRVPGMPSEKSVNLGENAGRGGFAGGHCIPVVLPAVARMIWHKLYSSTHRATEPAKAEKDLVQAVTLAAILIEQENVSLRESFRRAPQAVAAAADRNAAR